MSFTYPGGYTGSIKELLQFASNDDQKLFGKDYKFEPVPEKVQSAVFSRFIVERLQPYIIEFLIVVFLTIIIYYSFNNFSGKTTFIFGVILALYILRSSESSHRLLNYTSKNIPAKYQEAVNRTINDIRQSRYISIGSVFVIVLIIFFINLFIQKPL